MSDHPHTRNVQRDDPVTRYQRYSQLWKEQQAPGEKDHRNLRWNVRGHMTQFDNVHKVRYYGDWVMDVERNLLKALCYVTYEFHKIKLPSLIMWLFKNHNGMFMHFCRRLFSYCGTVTEESSVLCTKQLHNSWRAQTQRPPVADSWRSGTGIRANTEQFHVNHQHVTFTVFLTHLD